MVEKKPNCTSQCWYSDVMIWFPSSELFCNYIANAFVCYACLSTIHSRIRESLYR